MPDNRELKSQFAATIAKELEEGFSHKAVTATADGFPKGYKVQASGRAINLFYLDEGLRERIESDGERFSVANTNIVFTKEALFAALKETPEKFSPNVILRPLYQEIVLPDVAFIGGGGELAYWLELKKVFEAAGIFMPVLLLRNSFALVGKNVADTLTGLSLGTADIFTSEQLLLEQLVKRSSAVQLDLIKEKEALTAAYDRIKKASSTVDPTLAPHTEALHKQALRRLDALEKKMLKAEKKKFAAEQRQLSKIKNALFPGGVLQERSANILEWLSVDGNGFLDMLYQHSQPLPESFTVLTEQ